MHGPISFDSNHICHIPCLLKPEKNSQIMATGCEYLYKVCYLNEFHIFRLCNHRTTLVHYTD